MYMDDLTRDAPGFVRGSESTYDSAAGSRETIMTGRTDSSGRRRYVSETVSLDDGVYDIHTWVVGITKPGTLPGAELTGSLASVPGLAA